MRHNQTNACTHSGEDVRRRGGKSDWKNRLIYAQTPFSKSTLTTGNEKNEL